MQLSREHLIGTWRFDEWTIERDGRVTRPMQPDPDGMIIYTPNGVMSAAMYAGGRASFPSADIKKQPDSAKAAAFDSYFHYAGTWRIVGETVVHQVTSALNPNMAGTEQVRHVDLDGDRLTLSVTETLEGGGSRHHRLVWRRFNPAA